MEHDEGETQVRIHEKGEGRKRRRQKDGRSRYTQREMQCVAVACGSPSVRGQFTLLSPGRDS